MSILLKNSIYNHIPKTGGLWVKKALKNTNITFTELGELRESKIKGTKYIDIHSVKIPLEFENKFKFTFVRNPIDWYISRWRCPWHRKRLRDKNIGPLDCIGEQESKDFNIWMERILEE